MKPTNRLLHRYIGILAGLLLAILGLTGSALIFNEEIGHFLYPQLTHVQPVGQPISLQQVSNIVNQKYPKYKLQSIGLEREPDQPFHATIRSKKKSSKDVYINPYSGEILGTVERDRTLMGIIDKIHTSFLAGEPGKFVVGICGVLLIIRSISGLIITPGWKRLSTIFKVRWQSPLHLVNYDLHKVLGIVAVVFLVSAGATGAMMEFNQPVRNIGYALNGIPQPKKPVSIPQDNIQPPTLDQFLQTAETALPGGKSTFIFPATDKKAAVRVRKLLPGDISPSGRSFVYLNQYNGEVLRVDNINYAPWVEKLLAWMYPIHVGSYGGVGVRALYVILGIILAILFVTGVTIFWNKTYGAASKRKDA